MSLPTATAAWLLAVTLALPALAFEDGPTPAPPSPWRFSVVPEQWQRDIPPAKALFVPTQVTRDDEVQRVTLKEAIAIALESNPGIAARRYEPTRVEQDVVEAQGIFDPAANGSATWSSTVTPNPSALTGTRTSNVDARTFDLGLSKLFRSGTQLGLDATSDRLDNNAEFYELRPQYTPSLGFSLVQPLLRDFGWDFTYLVVRAAERGADAARWQFEADLQDFVTRVIVAYWRVVGTREAVTVQRESKALADRTVEENRARVDVGLLPPVAVLEAQSQATARETQVIEAENDLDVARTELAQLAFFRPSGTFVPRTLEPVEGVDLETVRPDLDEALDLALVRRPEVHASAQGVELRQIQERLASNALLPRLDLVGGYGVNGLAGRPRVGTRTVTFVSQAPVPGRSCSFISAEVYLCELQVVQPTSPFAGSERQAWDRTVSGDYESYNFGVQLQVPLDNAAARGRHTRSAIELNQAELRHRELLSQVTLEVRRSGADVSGARERIASSRVARELAEENLRNQTKRHEVGMATTKDLLDFQTQLTQARFAEVQANIDYAVAVARWRRAQGVLLEHYQIEIARPGERSTPWFARF